MKKYCEFIPLIIFIFLCYSCTITTMQDIEKKKLRGDETIVYYNYNWEKVYNAIKYVIQHSCVEPITMRNKIPIFDIHYPKNRKRIFIYESVYKVNDHHDVVIFFESITSSETKVEFIRGDYGLNTNAAIRYIVDESKFYLGLEKPDYDAFMKYTRKNQLKWQKELDEQFNGKRKP